MKVHCPACSQLVLAADISLESGWGKCASCQEVFALADVIEGFTRGSLAPVTERPFDAWAIVERDNRSMSIFVPAQGMRAGTMALLGFAIFWLAFIAFWTAGALGVLFNGGGIKWENAAFAAFSTPFWLVGLGMLVGVLWSSRGTRSVMIDAVQLTTELRCLFWRRRRTIDRDQVQCAREGDTIVTKNDGAASQHLRAVEIIFSKGSFKIPCSSEAEKDWLLSEINGFLKQVPYDARGHRKLDLGKDRFDF